MVYNIVIGYVRLPKTVHCDQITIDIDTFIYSSLLELSKNNQSFVAFVEIRTKAFNGERDHMEV